MTLSSAISAIILGWAVSVWAGSNEHIPNLTRLVKVNAKTKTIEGRSCSLVAFLYREHPDPNRSGDQWVLAVNKDVYGMNKLAAYWPTKGDELPSGYMMAAALLWLPLPEHGDVEVYYGWELSRKAWPPYRMPADRIPNIRAQTNRELYRKMTAEDFIDWGANEGRRNYPVPSDQVGALLNTDPFQDVSTGQAFLSDLGIARRAVQITCYWACRTEIVFRTYVAGRVDRGRSCCVSVVNTGRSLVTRTFSMGALDPDALLGVPTKRLKLFLPIPEKSRWLELEGRKDAEFRGPTIGDVAGKYCAWMDDHRGVSWSGKEIALAELCVGAKGHVGGQSEVVCTMHVIYAKPTEADLARMPAGSSWVEWITPAPEPREVMGFEKAQEEPRKP